MKKRKLISSILVTCLVLSMFTFGSSANEPIDELQNLVIEKVNLTSDILCMDDYAGIYYDDDYNLVISYTNDSKEIKNELKKYLKKSNIDGIVKFVKVKNSRKTLENQIQVLLADYRNYDFISGFGIYDDRNIIYVEVTSLTNENRKIIESLVDKSMLVIEEVSDFKLEYDVYAHPGDHLYSAASSGFSFGFVAEDGNGDRGFVTTGHGVFGLGTYVAKSGYTLGQVTAWENNYYTDACFVNVDAFDPNRTDLDNKLIQSNEKLGRAKTTITVGSDISKYGKSTGETHGEILATSAYVVWGSGIKFYAKADYSSSGGDSGGPISIKNPYSTISGTEFYDLIGIHNGSKDGYRYFTTYANIAYYLDIRFAH